VREGPDSKLCVAVRELRAFDQVNVERRSPKDKAVLKTDDANLQPLAEPSELCLGVTDGCGSDQKLELVLCEKSGDRRLELRLVAWGEGIGWYRQQTFGLPADLSVFEGLIGRARRLMSRRSRRSAIRGKLLTFSRQQQPAVDD
jgi:hypothetical protein